MQAAYRVLVVLIALLPGEVAFPPAPVGAVPEAPLPPELEAEGVPRQAQNSNVVVRNAVCTAREREDGARIRRRAHGRYWLQVEETGCRWPQAEQSPRAVMLWSEVQYALHERGWRTKTGCTSALPSVHRAPCHDLAVGTARSWQCPHRVGVAPTQWPHSAHTVTPQCPHSAPTVPTFLFLAVPVGDEGGGEVRMVLLLLPVGDVLLVGDPKLVRLARYLLLRNAQLLRPRSLQSGTEQSSPNG